jgi:hypothetical protein
MSGRRVAGLVANGMAASTVKSTYLTGSQVFVQAVTDGLIGRTVVGRSSSLVAALLTNSTSFPRTR